MAHYILNRRNPDRKEQPMGKTRMLAKISVQYWRHHKKRFFTLMLTLILGVGALCCSALLIRSEKQAVLEERLRSLGNYDVAIYSITDDMAEKIGAVSDVDALGMYYELGYVQNNAGAKFYAAAFADDRSEDIYHMTCSRGHYPENDSEIAMDVSVAKGLGIKPYPGEKITLSLYSADDEYLAEKEYTLSGVYEDKSATVYAGWLRYPYDLGEGGYNKPGIYFHHSQNDIFKSKSVAAFIQTDAADFGFLYNSAAEITGGSMTWQQVNGRRFAYSYVLGIAQTIGEIYGDNSFESIFAAMENGYIIKDFYSSILMPLFSVIIFIIVILTVVGIIKNIIRDKQDNFAVLSSLGLEKKHLKTYITCDFTVTALICIAVGLGLGALMHIGMINLLNSIYDLKLQYGFSCESYVNAATLNPFILSSVAMILCTEFAVFISLRIFKGKTPIQLFEDDKIYKTKKRKDRPADKYRSWKRLLVRRIKLRNGRIAIVSILVMGIALFGYTYFNALSDQDNSELRWEKQQSGLEYWDYKAEKTDQGMYVFNIENNHDNGVSQSDYAKLKDTPYVKDIFARIVNRSTRLSFENGSLSEDAYSALKEYSVRQYGDTDMSTASDLDKALRDSEEAVIASIGYSQSEQIFSCPTVGLFDKDLEKLKEFTVDGEIDIDKLRSGSEALLVMTDASKSKFYDIFKVGDTLPISDIKLDESEDKIDFAHFEPSGYEPVYKKNVKTEDGMEVPLTSYAFGTRKDIDTKVGAIIVLDTDEAKQYMTYARSGNYGMNVFCSVDAFSVWGLDDSNLTDVSMKLKSDDSIDKADTLWYDIMSGSKNMVSHSTAEITASMNKGAHKIMSIYYCMMIILTLIAAVTIAISLYTDIRIRSSKFAMLRACGMSMRQILFMIIRQNIIYPIIGAVFSIVPVALCQAFFKFVLKKLESGAWEYENVKWTRDIPYIYNLYDYNVVGAIVVIFAVYLVLILLVTLPQIYFLRRQSITDEIEKSSF